MTPPKTTLPEGIEAEVFPTGGIGFKGVVRNRKLTWETPIGIGCNKWERLMRVVGREGSYARTSVFFYVAVVQEDLLYESES